MGVIVRLTERVDALEAEVEELKKRLPAKVASKSAPAKDKTD